MSIPSKHVAIVWTKFLPYHIARINHLRRRLHAEGHTLTAIEVASKDALYPFPDQTDTKADYVCIFSGKSYRALPPLTIQSKITAAIEKIAPDVIISPSTPFPSGMASIKYCMRNKKISAIMDDAWEFSDKRGVLIKTVKKIIHKNVDAAFIPSAFHASYYHTLGFTDDRIVYGVDVVDNDFFANHAQKVREQENTFRRQMKLPQKYFIFVGRFIKRKGIETLLRAYSVYRNKSGHSAWDLVLVGDGIDSGEYRIEGDEIDGVHFAGAQFGEALCSYYGLASALILPSEVETWGLVVNEAMASGLPVIASSGCGAGRAMIEEGKNGWLFPPNDHQRLAALMDRVSSLQEREWESISEYAQRTIRSYSLDTFADSVLKILGMPVRNKTNITSKIITTLWPGRISFYP